MWLDIYHWMWMRMRMQNVKFECAAVRISLIYVYRRISCIYAVLKMERERGERGRGRVQERCSKVCSLKISFIHIFHMNARKPRSSRIYSDLTLQPLVWGRHAFFFDIFLKPRFGLILWYFKWKFLLLEVALVNVILQSNAVVSFSEYVPVLVCVRLSIERI